VFVVVERPTSYSYGSYLTAPGTSSNGERTVEWIRDHGGDGIVNRVEQWFYTRKPPGPCSSRSASATPKSADSATALGITEPFSVGTNRRGPRR
jgi:hypothetical protein